MSSPVEAVVRLLIERGQTIAVAESLTGGLVCAALVDVPGVSAVLRGGIVAYATDLKSQLLRVDPTLLETRGAVDAEVALAMARGAAAALVADWAVSTTGVAGPDPQDGAPPGRVFVAVCGPGAETVETAEIDGDRAQVRAGTVDLAIAVVARCLAGHAAREHAS